MIIRNEGIEMIIKCNACGQMNDVKDGCFFCTSCGNRLNVAPGVQTGNVTPPVQPKKSGNKGMKIALIIIAVLAVISLVAATVLLVLKFKTPDIEAETETETIEETTEEEVETYVAPTLTNGETILFGSYPQTKVTDEEIIGMLNMYAPATDEWTSYGYTYGPGGMIKYHGWDDPSGVIDMKYCDFEYEGEKYRGVYFTQYRPEATLGVSDTSSKQYKNGYTTGTAYWFLFEPIEWTVLNEATGLIITTKAIDSQPYSTEIHRSTIDNDEFFCKTSPVVYSNNYKYTTIRSWLLGDFKETAFTEGEACVLKETQLDNRHYTSRQTDYNINYPSEDTTDDVSMLSWTDAKNFKVGGAEATDYAQCQGVEMSNGKCANYWLRTPGVGSGFGDAISSTGAFVDYVKSDYELWVCYTKYGVRPTVYLEQ